MEIEEAIKLVLRDPNNIVDFKEHHAAYNLLFHAARMYELVKSLRDARYDEESEEYAEAVQIQYNYDGSVTISRWWGDEDSSYDKLAEADTLDEALLKWKEAQ